MTAELEEKTGRIVTMLGREGLDAILLNAQHNFAWLTGGRTNGIDLSRENGAASLLVTRAGKRFVVANNIEMPRIFAEEVSSKDFEALEFTWQGEKAASGLVIEMARSVLENGRSLATDIPIDRAAEAVESKIASCRYQLTVDELVRYRKLGRDAGAAVRRVIDKVVPGETEIEVAEKMRREFAVDGIAAVVTLAAADDRIAQYRHPVPTSKRWRSTLLLVICAKRGGLITSLSRLVCVGNISDDLKQKTDATAFVNAALLDATRPGVSGSELYAAAASAYNEIGYAKEIDRHHQGGAAGYKTREWVAHPQSTEVVQPDQAFAWNPSVTGTKVEETCISGHDGSEIITASPDFPCISTMIGGREYLSPGILSL